MSHFKLNQGWIQYEIKYEKRLNDSQVVKVIQIIFKVFQSEKHRDFEEGIVSLGSFYSYVLKVIINNNEEFRIV